MTRLVQKQQPATYLVWQPGDGTSYDLVVYPHPHGGLVLHWTNGRSSRKGQEPLPSCWWSRGCAFRDLVARLKASMKVLPYDAEALAVCMAEAGFAQGPAVGDLKKFFADERVSA